MSGLGFMVDSVAAERDGKRMLLADLGKWSAETAARFDALRAWGLGRRNFEFVGNRHVFLKVPPRKLAPLLDRFPIVEGETYWRATHHWRGEAAGEEAAPVPQVTPAA